MKLKLIKEEKINGDIFYFTEKDGRYVSDSLCTNLKQAEDIYNNILADEENAKGKLEVIKETIISN